MGIHRIIEKLQIPAYHLGEENSHSGRIHTLKNGFENPVYRLASARIELPGCPMF